ncbi:hypothetical protein BDQ17DRAFT_1351327 [Cyathus striatus]|nr:hypothetical protein BDQ17DRAFT_1351327 [Cyathus striatus]
MLAIRRTLASCKRQPLLQSSSQWMATVATSTRRLPKEEEQAILPDRFAVLKKGLWKDTLVESWRELLLELEVAAEEVASRGSEGYKEGLSTAKREEIKKAGSVIVTGAVSREEALGWKQAIRDYAAANASRVKGFPPDNIQVFEIYNSKAQTNARTHPGLINTQRFLLSLWHASNPGNRDKFNTPISYYDRLRIRNLAMPNGGALERWEDPGFRSVFGKILEGSSSWKQFDPYDALPRNQCTVFRPWQGWTSLSSTGQNEGTLRLLPMLSLASTYIILRPFFKPRNSLSSSLKFEDWEVDTESFAFPGNHPHLQLDKTMTSIPRVEPGDQVYWHCDCVHAVEAKHSGSGDSSVLYIPLASYLRDQRNNFVAGLPPPDFPGGEGESKFAEGKKMLGFERFESSTDGSKQFIDKVNDMLSL